MITSGKGGVGKTTFAANLSVTLARKGQRVVVVDTNAGRRSLDIFMGMECRVVYDLTDAVTGVCRMKQAVVKDKRLAGLHLLSAPQSYDKPPLTAAQMEEIYGELRGQYDYIIVDGTAGSRETLLVAAAGADRAVLVTCPEFAALRSTDMISRLLLKEGVSRRSFVVNKVHPELFGTEYMPSLEEMTETLRLPLVGVIPYDVNFILAANSGTPLTLDGDSYVSENFDQMAGTLFGV